MRVTIQPDFQQLLTAYTNSKTLRLGVVYLEGSNTAIEATIRRFRLSHDTLRKYAQRVSRYFYAKAKSTHFWHYSEDNFLMANYQVRQLAQICQALPHRTPNAIKQRALRLGVAKERNLPFLGVAKERKAFTN
jgi:hypothetical protein